MPTISRFFGILIRMYHRDHGPPHFHVEYGEFEAQIEIATLSVLRGWLPRRTCRLVRRWARLRQSEIEENWNRAARHKALRRVPPLK